MVSPAFPGLFFTFAAAVLLIFVSVSAPTWKAIYFLKASVSGTTDEIRYGVFGYCLDPGSCSGTSLGYDLTTNGLGTTYSYNTEALYRLTQILIVHPIAAGLAGIAMLWGLIGAIAASRVCTIFMTITSFIALVAALLCLAIDLALWIIFRNHLRDNGFDAMLGNANWLVVGACASLILATCTSALGSCGRFATGRMGGEKY